jgi:hypothetical protein
MSFILIFLTHMIAAIGNTFVAKCVSIDFQEQKMQDVLSADKNSK